MGIIDYAIGFGRVTATSIAEQTKDVLYQILGLGGFTADGAGDQVDEKRSGFGGVGLISNPLPPEKIDSLAYQADIIFIKQGDQLVPVAWRDLRLNRNFPGGIKPGSVALAGYGGGFYSLDLTAGNSGSRKANIHVLYCPFNFDSNGVPQKAHTIIIDPDANVVNLQHADGGQIILLPAKEMMMIADNDTWFKMKPGKIDMQATTVTMAATVIIGNPATAAPIAASTATLASTRLLYSIA